MKKKKVLPPRFRFLDAHKFAMLTWAKRLFWIIVVLILIFRFVIGISVVSGNSMQPTLENGTWVGYTRLIRNYERGDVVCVREPSDRYYVKRIIALGGDTVDLREGKVFVNGQALDEPGILGPTDPADSTTVTYPLTLDANQVFVMGDNRPESIDSRAFGPVSLRQVTGKLWGVE